MMVLPVAPAESSAAGTKPDPAGDGAAFAETLAGAIDATSQPSTEPASGEAPDDRPVASDPVAALLAMLAGLPASQPAIMLKATAELPVALVETAGLPGAQPLPAPPTAGALAALVQAVAGEDLVAPAVLVLQPAPVTMPAVLPDTERHPAAEFKPSNHEGERPTAPFEPVPLPPTFATPIHATGERPVEPALPKPIVEQVATQLAGKLDTAGEFTVTLQPESLGTVDITIRVDPSGIHVALAADDSARDLLNAGLADLRSALRPADGRDLVIDIGPRLSGGFDPNQLFQRGGQPNPFRPANFQPAGDEPADSTPAATVAAGRIDYRI
jgi:hypothetical protein